MATNIVLAGSFEGGEIKGEIKLSSSRKCAYVIKGTQTKYINKLNVEKIIAANRSTTNNIGDTMVGETLFGHSGVLLGVNQKEIFLEINWKDGNSSLIKVDNAVHEAIIVGMYNDISQIQEILLERKDASTHRFYSIIGFIILIIGILTYIIPST